MRRLSFLSIALMLSACAGGAPEPAAIVRPASAPVVVRGDLIGSSTNDLVSRFGAPQFQVREGQGLKLQWSVPSCILDVYLYPPVGAASPERATFADARRPTGEGVDPGSCAAALGAR